MWIHTSMGMLNSDYVVRIEYRGSERNQYCITADGQAFRCYGDIGDEISPSIPNTTRYVAIVAWWWGEDAVEIDIDEEPIVAWRDCGDYLRPLLADEVTGDNSSDFVIFDPETGYWVQPHSASGKGRESAVTYLREQCAKAWERAAAKRASMAQA